MAVRGEFQVLHSCFRQITPLKAFLPKRSCDSNDTSPLPSPPSQSLASPRVKVVTVSCRPSDPSFINSENTSSADPPGIGRDVADQMAPGIEWLCVDSNSKDEVSGGPMMVESLGANGWHLNLFLKVFPGGHNV